MKTTKQAVKVCNEIVTDRYAIYNGDCVDTLKGLPDGKVHYSIFSPPFSSLYTYSAHERDMGNCKNVDEFFAHFEFVIAELMRVTMPGRLCSFHCMNLPSSKQRDGFIGIKDFRGQLIAAFQKHGWVYHSEVCIWKDPVTAMQRTKAKGLLYKQLKKDSCESRQGIADYLVTMRKNAPNPEPVTKKGDRIKSSPDDFTIDMWQKYASPVWMDVDATKTLQSIREEKDERHICPLQLDVIERAIRLWTNPNDLVLTPFLGIGSEIYQAVKMGRRGIGIELKTAYFLQAAKNLKKAVAEIDQGSLFKN